MIGCAGPFGVCHSLAVSPSLRRRFPQVKNVRQRHTHGTPDTKHEAPPGSIPGRRLTLPT